jgi:asparagine synthase (glutamine-hydrolysing)
MCGIFCHVQKTSTKINSDEEIKKTFDTIKNRGPDSSTLLVFTLGEYEIHFGFHRLAIIDTSESSNTILTDGHLALTCNGEIYNYKHLIQKYKLQMNTGSDCEVILQLYKTVPHLFPKILEELDGVFAFILVDKEKQIIHAARDRFGVRPIFWGNDENSIGFASEGKAVKSSTARQVPPGTWTTILIRDKVSIYQDYWMPQGIYYNVPFLLAQEISRSLFIDAVRKRLMSDRPIGFLLSGGLDSSLVASVGATLLKQRGIPKIKTFSIGLADSKDIIAARIVANYLQSEHHEVIITINDIILAIPDVIYAGETFDITTIRASVPMYLLAKYIRENTDIKVVFSGEGADELLCGYLYSWNAPSPVDLQQDSHRLLAELHKYDLLRGDRMISSWGLELRVPFLDASLVAFVANIDPVHKMPTVHGIEKALFREAFIGFLPLEILRRQKVAFSDGVGTSSVTSIKQFAEKYCSENIIVEPDCVVKITTMEGLMYFDLFVRYFGGKMGLYTEKYWMPQWCPGVIDPSATVLSVYRDE